MSPKTIAALIGAFVILVVVSPYFLGRYAEKNLRAFVEVPQLADLMTVEVLEYDRGWFSSKIEISMTPAGFLKDYLETLGNAVKSQRALLLGKDGVDNGQGAPLEFSPLGAFPLKEKITLEHGPLFFAGRPGVGIGRLKREFDFIEYFENLASKSATAAEGATTAPDIELTGGSAMIRGWTTLGFGGKISSRGEIPKGAMRVGNSPTSAVLEWTGGESAAAIDLASGLIEAEFNLGSGTVLLDDNFGTGGKITIAPMMFRAKGEMRSIWNFLGDSEVTWDGFVMENNDGMEFRLEDFSATSSQVASEENPELTNTTSSMRVAELVLLAGSKDILFGPIELELAYRNMDMTAYGKIIEASLAMPNAFQANATPDPEAGQQMVEHLNNFLAAGPEIEFSRFDLVSSLGNLELSFLVQVAPGTAISENVLEYIGGISGESSFAIDESLAQLYVRSMARQQAALLAPEAPPNEEQIVAIIEQLLAGYTNAGLLNKEDGRYRSDLEFVDGKAIVNGQMVFDAMQQQ